MQSTEASHPTSKVSDYERNIPSEIRLRNGQYYTTSDVCDFMIALSQPATAGKGLLRILEPGCGAGNFLLRLANRFSTTLSPEEKPQFELHGVELDQEAANLAQSLLPTENKTIQTSIHTMNFISPAADQLGTFDWMIGNPPYVRQEHLTQSQQLNKTDMLNYLLDKYQNYLQQFPTQRALFRNTSDLYLYFFLQATTLLKPGGHLAFITSNSWLNTAIGLHFQQFLTHHYNIQYLVESACERWFNDAAINSIIVVLEKKSTQDLFINSKNKHPKISGQINPVKLIRLIQPLAHYLPTPQQSDYWPQLEQTVRLNFHEATASNQFQIKLLSVQQLQSEPLKGNWSLALRASSTFSQLFNQPMLWQKLEDLGQVRYPLKTGINAFFYLDRNQVNQWQIEPEFLLPVLRSSRQVKSYTVQADQLQAFLFCCPYTKSELKAQGKKGALAYIEWGENQSAQPRQKRAQPVLWPQVPSVQSNRPWHYTKPLKPAHILCPRFIDQRFFFPLCKGGVMEDQTFYGLTLTHPDTYSPLLLAALLNSTLSYLLAEYSGRTNLGEGVLQFARADMACFSVIHPDLFSAAEKEELIATFVQLNQREILPLAQELISPDRVVLDRLILGALIRAGACHLPLEDLRSGLCTELWSRLQERSRLAKSVKPKKY